MRSILLLFKSKRLIALVGLVTVAALLAVPKLLNLSLSSLMPKMSKAASLYKPPAEPTMTPMDASFLSIVETSMRNMTDEQLENLYYSITRHKQIDCWNSRRIGLATDGGWDVCFTAPFGISNTSGRPCVAFSFGINNVFDYDDILADTYNCRVYMFDPSMTNVENHQRKPTSWFYRIGLGSSNSVLQNNNWTMRTLCTLFDHLGWKDSQIDLLKVDIELWEWDSFDTALREGCLPRVRQLLFESHTDHVVSKRPNYAKMIRVWLGLFKAGFRAWKWHENPLSAFFNSASGDKRACCHEHYMVNVKYL